jgi:hypothetical protein
MKVEDKIRAIIDEYWAAASVAKEAEAARRKAESDLVNARREVSRVILAAGEKSVVYNGKIYRVDEDRTTTADEWLTIKEFHGRVL